MKSLHIKSHVIVLSIIGILVLQSCSNDTRVTQAREKLEQQVQDESKGLAKLKSLEKVNGQEQNLMGSKMYELDFKATVEYKEDCYKSDEEGWSELLHNYFTVVKNPQQAQRGFYNLYSRGNYLHYAKGSRDEITGVAIYEMKENGWFLNGVNLKSSKHID
ncbi:MAG TPA: hypothetical protein VGM63_04440 [Mucilaginibacter sp.]|jgi:hypothetical protein